LPFAVPFFLACDGGIAPLLGLSPGLARVPWQLSVKELLNHVAWTATAETAHRLARRT
jgi:putative membrane protein